MKAYRLLLLLFPASFRAEYGEEMSKVFAARRGRENALELWIVTILDMLSNALRVHADVLWQDLRWTSRVLRQSPGFTLTAVSVAALGMGANTTAFTLLDHVLLRPLPFSHPEQLVTLYQTQPANGYTRSNLSPPNYLDLRAMTKSFEAVSAYSGLSINLSGQGDPQRLDGANVGAGLFQILGVQPTLGRGFVPEDERNGTPDSVLLSDHLWRTQFGADSSVLGRTIRLDDQPYTIIGVMPAHFAFPSREAELWIPLRFPPFIPGDRANYYLYGVARLRKGVSLEQARADLSVAAAQLERAYPRLNAGVGATASNMRDAVSPQSRMLIIAVFGAAFCVLLIACSNLANLLLARAMTRRREIAVRIAIGAGRERLLRQLLTENLVLAVAGGALGLLLAKFATPWLARLAPNALPVSGVPEVDMRVFAFAAALTLVSSIAFGVGPALRACGSADMNALRGRSGSGGRSDRLRSALVLAEVAGTVVLLIAGGLLVKALWRVQSVSPGFRAEGVLTMRTVLPMPKYSETSRRTRFYSAVLSEARALPGVTSAAYISFLPMVMRGGIWPVKLPGMSEEDESRARVSLRFVTPDFFKTLKVPLREGRDVSDGDTRNSPFVALVSESFARRYWKDQDPIGKHLEIAFFDRTVVGVVADISVRGLEESSEPQVYLSAQQVPNGGLPWFAPKDLVIRAEGNPAALAPALRRIIRQADPEQAISDVQLLEDIIAGETASRRAQLRVLGAFAIIAFLLAAVGIHGLLSFAVSSRTQEVGVRIALGATRNDILGMFLRQGLALGLAGVTLAVPLAYTAARAMASLLFGVQPGDSTIYAAAALLALLMTLAGSLRPALRAAGVDPAITIRSE
jgi:putative ABC transport system permease protein